MNHREILLKLCQKTNEARLNALKAELGPRKRCDLDGMALVIPSKERNAVVIAAHFDAAAGSLGFNDNGMALVAVLSVLDHLPVNVEVVFTNGEERGFLGAQYYLEHTGKHILSCMNLDVCGFGEQIYLDPMNFPLSKEFCTGCKTGRMPSNDAAVFADRGIPAFTLSAGPGAVPFQEGIGRICETIHGGPLDNRPEILNFGLIGTVGKKILEAVRKNA